MRTSILIILGCFILMICRGQTDKNNTMNRNLPEGIWFQKNYDILWNKDDEGKGYLTQIIIQKPEVYFYSEEKDYKLFNKDEITFSMDYYISTTNRLSKTGISYYVIFIKDSPTSNYKIFEASFLQNWETRDNILSPFKPMSFEAAPSPYRFIGYSSDQSLDQVKILNIAKKDFNLNAALKQYKEQ